MSIQPDKIVVARMETRNRRPISPVYARKHKRITKRLLRNTVFLAAVSLCLGGGHMMLRNNPDATEMVMSRLTADFEYDETIGRLQFVSNLLPESAMVFLSSDTPVPFLSPADGSAIAHVWSEYEPWLEYTHTGDILACQAGEVMTIVKNRQNEYTVRLRHADGYESVYSGLEEVRLSEHDTVEAGQRIGAASGFAAFELRKEGLSINPVFEEL